MDKLGRRLAADGRVADDDRQLFSSLIDFYQSGLDSVTDKLVELGYSPTSRVKTTGTLTEKLQREHGIQLTRIDDVAGARIVVDGGRAAQDKCVSEISLAFDGCDKKPKIADRRRNPSQHYRAVHVIVYPYGYPIEIQVRTELQNQWAQIFERMADQWGRQIRYGGEPDSVGRVPVELKQRGIDIMARLSAQIAAREQAQASQAVSQDRLDQLTKVLANSPPAVGGPRVRVPLSEVDAKSESVYQTLRPAILRGIEYLEPDRRRRNRIVRRTLPKNHLVLPGFEKTVHWTAKRLEEMLQDRIEASERQEKLLRETLDMLAEIPDVGGST